MSDKCEWKVGTGLTNELQFYPCDGFDGQMIYEVKIYENKGVDVKSCKCLHCHGNIRKPEPEKPLIVKSGETWAIYNFKINYLFMGHNISDKNLLHALFDSYNREENELFKPFSEIELTDEIAKLRPMVCGGIQKYTLYGVLKEEGIIWLLISDTLNDIEWYDNRLNDFRLATPHELQEQS